MGYRGIARCIFLLLAAALAVGCGASSQTPNPASSGHAGSATPAAGAALTGEAASAATGDIPDNQVFLVFKNSADGYSVKYPEGWAQRGAGRSVVFQDKNNIVRIAVRAGALPSLSSVTAEMTRLKQATPSLRAGAPRSVPVGAHLAVEVVYSTTSAADPVTGKTVTLLVNRYYLAAQGKLAVLDLGTPRGVDNVDAYRLMVASFTWH
jgi:hypothetical protein